MQIGPPSEESEKPTYESSSEAIFGGQTKPAGATYFSDHLGILQPITPQQIHN
jgi:hypothetical protein